MNKNQAIKLYDEFEDSLQLSYSNRIIKLNENPVWKIIQNLEKSQREEICILAFQRLLDLKDPKYNHAPVRRKVFKTEFNSKFPPSKNSLLKVFEACSKNISIKSYNIPINDLLFCFQYYQEHFGKDAAYMQARNSLINIYNDSYGDPKFKKFILGLQKLDHDQTSKIFDSRDLLGQFLDDNWENYSEDFREIIKHCWHPPQKSKPTKTWILQSQKFITKGDQVQIKCLNDIFELIISFGKTELKRMNLLSYEELRHGKNDFYLYESNETAVNYLVWYASLINNPRLNSNITEIALASNKKTRWIGSLSTKNGNACMHAFTIMPAKVGIMQLLNIKNKGRNKSIKNTAIKNIKRKAEELGLSEEALLELSVPTFNISKKQSELKIGDYTGIIDITELKKPISFWINNKTEKTQKSIPAIIKTNYAEDLKIFKSRIKEINTAISVHSKRIENTYLDDINWTMEDWKDNYISHPFLSQFSSKLIWLFDENKTGIFQEGEIVDSSGNPFNIEHFSQVKLWHPVYSKPTEVVSWRNFILNNEIKQPFKQAYREIYLITDAEIKTSTYSNRFAAHILYQHQFAALAKIRDWNYNLQGGFESHNTPFKSIPKFKLKAEYWVEGIQDSINEAGVFSYIAADQVRIYSGRDLFQMQDVPTIVFSEIMRDVDLFVGVTSIGNNPEWSDTGESRTYWHNYSFGKLNETAQTRKDVLQSILPKLKIRDRSKIKDKFLIINGKIRDYKIHLGSGNILMTPNDQYLCIVPDSRSNKSRIFLPFDNDKTLSIILSKAFMLYNDDKIKDTTITRQINL